MTLAEVIKNVYSGSGSGSGSGFGYNSLLLHLAFSVFVVD